MKNITNQNGRSMIEMLGVLAIVGVLSVGGIAGYSKAMQKYRVNKMIDQITQIANGVRTLYGQQKDYTGLNNYVLKKAKILPESVFPDVGSNNPNAYGTTAFGGGFFVQPTGKIDDSDSKAFIVGLRDLPEDACIEIFSQDWGDTSGLIAYGTDNVFFNGYFSNCTSNDRIQCAQDGPMSVDKAMDICHYVAEYNWTEIGFKFY